MTKLKRNENVIVVNVMFRTWTSAWSVRTFAAADAASTRMARTVAPVRLVTCWSKAGAARVAWGVSRAVWTRTSASPRRVSAGTARAPTRPAATSARAIKASRRAPNRYYTIYYIP